MSTHRPIAHTQIRLIGLDEWAQWQESQSAPEAPKAFDIDKACRDAMRTVLNRIDDVHTINRWAIGRDFAAARDHMVSRHRHQQALLTNLREVHQ